MTKWNTIIKAASVLCTGCAVLGLAAFKIMDHREWERWSVLLDTYPISAYELPPPLDLEIPMVYDWRQVGDIEVLRVKPEKIGPQHFRDSAIETQNHREPGGWIADDPPIIKGESVHPKGVQQASPDAIADPNGGYQPRADLKRWAKESDLAKVTVVRKLRGDKE